MSEHPEGSPEWDDSDEPTPEESPVQGQVRHSHMSARVPEEVGAGVFSNGVMILTGPYEIVLDFALRMGEQQRIAARVVLPHVVARQFISALQENIRNFEKRFGQIPQLPKPVAEKRPEPPETQSGTVGAGQVTAPEASSHPENRPAPPNTPKIEDIYHDLKLPDSMLSGRYANAVLIRHSPSEFCFDFITNVFPRSAVSTRVFLATPHVVPFLKSLSRSLTPPESGADPPL